MELVSVARNGEELGVLRTIKGMDVSIGGSNDFVLTFSSADWEKDRRISNAYYWYADSYSELGGIVRCIKSNTGDNTVQASGYTWRGMLGMKVILPAEGEDYRIVSGELNAVMANLIEPMFDGFFSVAKFDSGIEIKEYQFKRYDTLLNGISDMLETVNCKLKIQYVPGTADSAGYIEVSATPIIDYSNEIEYSQDVKIDFTARDYRMGVNHLICLGKGELKDRQVIHLFADINGNIGDEQSQFGADEIAAVYDYSSAESAEELRRAGEKRIKELGNYKELKINLNDMDAQIGDIVGGRERITGIVLRKQITEIVFKLNRGALQIKHKVGDKHGV